MADSLFFIKLKEQIDIEIADTAAPLIEGSCADFSEYKERSGMIAGLRRALQAAENVKKDIYGEH